MQSHDDELVAAVIAGHPLAFAVLYRRYVPLVRAVIVGRIRSRDECQDLAQETFMRAFQHIDQLSQPDRFRYWVAQIARRVAIDRQRGLARSHETGFSEFELDLIDQAAGPLELCEAAELAEDLRIAFSRLGERDALILRLAPEGYRTDELSATLGTSRTCAKVAVHRARSQLRRELSVVSSDRRGARNGGPVVPTDRSTAA